MRSMRIAAAAATRRLAKALASMRPEEVAQEVTLSGLRGRGGANFPVGAKWSFVDRKSGASSTCAATPTRASPARSRTAGSSSIRPTS